MDRERQRRHFKGGGGRESSFSQELVDNVGLLLEVNWPKLIICQIVILICKLDTPSSIAARSMNRKFCTSLLDLPKLIICFDRSKAYKIFSTEIRFFSVTNKNCNKNLHCQLKPKKPK